VIPLQKTFYQRNFKFGFDPYLLFCGAQVLTRLFSFELGLVPGDVETGEF